MVGGGDHGWNASPLWDVARVIDWTDLVALAVLPISYGLLLVDWERLSYFRIVPRRTAIVVFITSTCAFTATVCDPEWRLE